MSRITVDEYLRRPEGAGPQELAYGTLRAPHAPNADHESTVTRLTAIVDQHVRRHHLGRVYASPVDLVLDRERALIVQPDLVFVETGSEITCRESEPAAEPSAGLPPARPARIWGAADLVVEVLSVGTERHDRVTKLAWYRKYGVRECWLVDPVGRAVDVLHLARGQEEGARRLCRDTMPICSHVLGPLAIRTERLFRAGPASV